jgi:hypothetical protein
MAATTVRGGQVRDATIQRVDVDVATVGQALIRKLIQGTGISLSSTGADAGTGDVTASLLSFASVNWIAPSNPTGTSSTAGVMMGLGGPSKAVITPTITGKVFFAMNGNIANNTANATAFALLYYGSGTAPINGGTALTGPVGNQGTKAAGLTIPFALCGIATGLTLSTAYWFDLVVGVVGASTGSVSGINATAFELP